MNKIFSSVMMKIPYSILCNISEKKETLRKYEGKLQYAQHWRGDGVFNAKVFLGGDNQSCVSGSQMYAEIN